MTDVFFFLNLLDKKKCYVIRKKEKKMLLWYFIPFYIMQIIRLYLVIYNVSLFELLLMIEKNKIILFVVPNMTFENVLYESAGGLFIM
jgi:hypothetical protein